MSFIEWEYRGVACEPDTGDVYDSTRPFDTAAEAEQAARDWGLLESNADLPQLVLRIECRVKAGPWAQTIQVNKPTGSEQDA